MAIKSKSIMLVRTLSSCGSDYSFGGMHGFCLSKSNSSRMESGSHQNGKCWKSQNQLESCEWLCVLSDTDRNDEEEKSVEKNQQIWFGYRVPAFSNDAHKQQPHAIGAQTRYMATMKMPKYRFVREKTSDSDNHRQFPVVKRHTHTHLITHEHGLTKETSAKREGKSNCMI